MTDSFVNAIQQEKSINFYRWHREGEVYHNCIPLENHDRNAKCPIHDGNKIFCALGCIKICILCCQKTMREQNEWKEYPHHEKRFINAPCYVDDKSIRVVNCEVHGQQNLCDFCRNNICQKCCTASSKTVEKSGLDNMD
jgi:hypothetical protein